MHRSLLNLLSSFNVNGLDSQISKCSNLERELIYLTANTYEKNSLLKKVKMNLPTSVTWVKKKIVNTAHVKNKIDSI